MHAFRGHLLPDYFIKAMEFHSAFCNKEIIVVAAIVAHILAIIYIGIYIGNYSGNSIF